MELFRPGNNTYFDVRPKPNVRLKPSDSSFYLNLSLEWTLTFEHPYDEEGRWKQIVGDSVILIESPFHLSKQAFVVDNIQKGLYSMTVECHHYFNESKNEQVIDIRAVDATPQEAMNKLFEGTEFNGEAEAGFIDIGTAYFIEGNVLSFINGEDKGNTLMSRWGGEFFYDNRTLKWYERLNKNKVFNITFSHNLTDIGLEEDWKSIYTRIYPKAYNGRKLSEPYYINSERIDDYPRVKSTWVTYDNIGLKEDYENFNEDNPPEGMTLYDTQQQLEAALHREVKNLFDTGIDLPKISGTVNASILHNSLNRKGIIELPGLGYTVRVYNKLTNMEYQSRIIGIDWNTVKRCYNSIELGDPGDSSYFNQISSSMGNVDNIHKEIEEIKKSDKTDWNKVIQDTKNELTEYINNGTYYGHIKITPNELLILDDENVDKAVKIWRWNMGGLGFSLNGYGGPYEIAITAAGKMVINEATAETIKATMIKAGILASTDGSSWFNLDDGSFNWADGGITFDPDNGLKITVNGKTLDELLDENLVVSTNKEHQIVVLDEDGTPSYGGNYEFKFTTYKMGTTTKVDSVIKSATPSDDNVSVTFDPTGTTVNLVIDTNRQFTSMEGYIDVIVETKYHDVEKRITWSAITDVVDASFVRILPSSNIFNMKYNESSYKPNSITLTPLLSRCEFSSWSYSYDGETWTTIISGSNGLTINNGKLIISNSSDIFTEENNSVAFKVNCTEEVSDVTTIVRVRDGVQGNDSVVVQLDNENHSFLGNQAGQAMDSTIEIKVYGYSGVIQKPTTVGTINSPTGMTITVSGNNTINNKIKISVDSNLTSSGVVNIPITCMGITYNKVFSYNISLPGIDGEGARSISIQPSSMAFKYNTSSDDYSPSTIKLKYTLIDETFNKWQYSTNGGSTWSDVVNGSNGLTVNSDKTLTIASTADVFDHNGSLDVAVFKAWGVNGSEDIVTITRLRDGERGPQGIPGTSGSTYYTWIRYADDINGNGISNIPDGKEYIGFAYNKTTSTESNNPSDYKWSLIKGVDGIPGEKGKDGKTYYTWIKYSDNENGSNMYDIPTTNTKYIGIANNKLTSTEGTDPSEYTWSKFRGEDGVPGLPGKDGVTYYTWIRYADDANGNGISNNPNGKTYIGLAYNKTTPTESNKASDYKWSLISGKAGVPGLPGKDGVTYYTWIAYSDNPDGSPMYQTPTEKTKYIGIATNQLTSVEGTDPSVYTWSLFRGEDGKGIKTIVNYYLASTSSSGVTTSTRGWSTDIPTMTSTNKYLWNYEEITYTDGSKSTTVPLIIGVYGDKGATGSAGKGIKSITEYYLATSSNSGITTSTKGWSTTIPTITSTNKYLWNYEVIAYTDNSSTTSNPKIIGAYGDKGSTGTSATNVILGNENHTFAAQSNGQAVAATTNTTVIGYLGATQKACTIGTISGLPTGMTATIKNNGTTSASIDIAVTSSMTTKQGTLIIPVTCNNITFNKIFSYSLSLDGTPAPSARIVASSNSFLSSDGGKTYSPDSIKLSFSLVECTYSKWQYNTDGGSTWTNVTSGSNGFTINSDKTLSITVASALFGSLSGTIHLKLITSNSKAYDVITINKLVQVEDIGNQLSDIKSEITQTNNAWKAAFTTGNANNLLYDGDFKLGTDNWIAENSTITTGNSSAFPFYDKEKYMKITCPGAARYRYDLELKPDTDYVYEAWIYRSAVSITSGEKCPLYFWLWTGDTVTDNSSTLCEIKEYSNSMTKGKFIHCYIHFKTTNSPTTVVSWRGFIGSTKPTSGSAFLGVREVSLREASMPGAWQPNGNEVITGMTTINQNGIKVEHSEAGTYTQMDAAGFSIRDATTGDVFAWLSSKKQWTELKVDKVFAGNIENVYEGDANLYVNHAATVAGNGTADKPFNSFRQLAEYLQATPVINKDLYITVRDPNFVINEQLHLHGLKGSGFIKITLEGTLIIANPGYGQFCIRLTQIPKWVVIAGSREFGSATTGAVLCDGGNGDGHGIYAADVDRLQVDALTIACKNWGILTHRAHLYTWHVDFGKCYCAVELEYQSIYYSSDDVGSCVDFCRLQSGSFAYWGYAGGTPHRPQGNVQMINGMYYDGGIQLIPTDSPRFPTSNPAPPPTSGQVFTYTYNWTSHKTYAYSYNNWSDSDCKQGSWGYGLRGGHMFFDIATLRSQMTGTVQDGNTITLTRASRGGISGGANVYINGSTCSSASGTPSYGGQTLLGTLAWGETKTFTLPKAIVQGLVSGSYNSLAVYVNSSASNCYINIVNCSITLKTKK